MQPDDFEVRSHGYTLKVRAVYKHFWKGSVRTVWVNTRTGPELRSYATPSYRVGIRKVRLYWLVTFNGVYVWSHHTKANAVRVARRHGVKLLRAAVQSPCT